MLTSTARIDVEAVKLLLDEMKGLQDSRAAKGLNPFVVAKITMVSLNSMVQKAFIQPRRDEQFRAGRASRWARRGYMGHGTELDRKSTRLNSSHKH